MRPRRLRHPLPGLSGSRRRGRHRRAVPPGILRARRSLPRPLRLHPQSSMQKGLPSRPRHDLRRAPLRPPFPSWGSPKLPLQRRRRRVRSRPPLLNRDGPRMRLRLPQRQRRLRHRPRQNSDYPDRTLRTIHLTQRTARRMTLKAAYTTVPATTKAVTKVTTVPMVRSPSITSITLSRRGYGTPGHRGQYRFP